MLPGSIAGSILPAAATEQEWQFITRKPYEPNSFQPCREYLVANPPDYSRHPLYGNLDIAALKAQIEKSTGKPWIIIFARYWCDCHPRGDPVENLDLNWDGKTDIEDFIVLNSEF
jgi:hypothetical protein